MRIRSDDEMLTLILDVARRDDRIRAVYMNGSRTNPTIPRDAYQDFDIVYVVRETRPLYEDPPWPEVFGDTILVQEPDRVDWEWGIESDIDAGYAWLMLFEDGHRIDLTIQTAEVCAEAFLSDKLCVALLDKDGILPEIPPPTDVDFHVVPPTNGRFQACCNEFWWCMGSVGKGLARDEMPYVHWMLNDPFRAMLMRMLDWSVGVETGFSLSTGKQGKFLKRYLSANDYADLLVTYDNSSIDATWSAVDAMCALFRRRARAVAEHFSFDYPDADDRGISEYLDRIRESSGY